MASNAELERRLEILEKFLDGMERTDMTTPDGQAWEIPAAQSGIERMGTGAWSLVFVGGDNFSIEPGDVRTSYSDLSTSLEIQDRGHEFLVIPEMKVWLALDVTDPKTVADPEAEDSGMVLTLASGMEWPALVMEEGEGGLRQIKQTHFPLWEFVEGPRTKRSELEITSDIIGRQFLSSPYSLILWGSNNLDTRGWQRVMVPVLLPVG